MRFLNYQYIKRYRMELDVRRWRRPDFQLPSDYRLVAWSNNLLEDHAEIKYQSFRGELDAQVFPCLGEYQGCWKLMKEIQSREGFLPEATWLAEYVGAGPRKTEYCGTIQAVRTHRQRANIQNIGVVPFHRGFQYLGIPRISLEVTAENDDAVRLYKKLGFRATRTLYKAVELAPGLPTG